MNLKHTKEDSDIAHLQVKPTPSEHLLAQQLKLQLKSQGYDVETKYVTEDYPDTLTRLSFWYAFCRKDGVTRTSVRGPTEFSALKMLVMEYGL